MTATRTDRLVDVLDGGVVSSRTVCQELLLKANKMMTTKRAKVAQRPPNSTADQEPEASSCCMLHLQQHQQYHDHQHDDSSSCSIPLECLDDVKELESVLAYSNHTKDGLLLTLILGLVALLDCILFYVAKDNNMNNSNNNSNNMDHRHRYNHRHHLEQVGKRKVAATILFFWRKLLLFWKRKEVVDLMTEVEKGRKGIFSSTSFLLDIQKIQNVISHVFVILWILDDIYKTYHIYWKENCKRIQCHCCKEEKKQTSMTWSKSEFVGLSSAAVASGFFFLRLVPLWMDLFLQQVSIVGYLGFEHAKQYLFGILKYVAKLIATFAFYHPLHFRQRLVVTIKVVRWLRYILPIVSSMNTIWSNFKRFVIVYRQNRAARLARGVKKKLWNRMTREERAEKAALRLQCNFRRWKASKYVKSLPNCNGVNYNSKMASAILLQRTFRRCLLRNRSKIRLKGKKLQELCSMTPNHLTLDDLIKKNELENELRRELKEKKRTVLLIRPNSSFSTVWKAVVLVAILLDMIPQNDFGSDGKYDTSAGLKSNVVASFPFSVERYDLSKAVMFKLPNEATQWCKKKKASWGTSRWLNIFGFVRNRHMIMNFSEKQPWYCRRTFIGIQGYAFFGATLIMEKISVFIGIILLFDVFITFFTGDFNHVGMLVPQPFVKRWIMGLGLKLITNPLTKPMTTSLFQFIIDVGPGRVTYWYLAVFGPLSEYVFLTNRWFRILQAIRNN